MEVDWAGQPAYIVDDESGEALEAFLFVAVMPYSGYAYAEAFLNREQEAWITANVNAFEYFGGVARILVPDNLKTGVIKNTKAELVLNRTYQELAQLAIARAEGTYRKVMKQLKQIKLLILDEWLLYPLRETEARDLLEIVEVRYKKASTIFCSQHDVGDWHSKIGESTIAEAVLDRIVHDAYRIVIASDRDNSVSMRQRKGLAAE